MTQVPIPQYAEKDRPATVHALRGILDHDQYDDWLPDPIYFEDRRRFETLQVTALDALASLDRRELQASVALELPRSGRKRMPALALKLEERVLLHRTAGAIAQRMAASSGARLMRDKVFGFEYQQGQVPLFSPPGDALDRALDQALQEPVDELSILDVVGFSARAKLDSLATTLQGLGVRREDELPLLRGLLASGSGCLPSTDDAAAFLYNFYLGPVDGDLASARENFVRYRDEYFVFGAAGRTHVSGSAAKLKLELNETRVDLGELRREMRDELQRRLERDQEAAGSDRWDAELDLSDERSVAAIGSDGSLACTCLCQGWTGDGCTDGFEYRFKFMPLEDRLQALWASDPKDCDAVAVLPILRAVHQRRAPQALHAAALETASGDFAEYRRQLEAGRARLAEFIVAARASGLAWAIGWSARMLSDLAPLRREETELLASTASDPTVASWARAECALALARASDRAAEAVLEALEPVGDEHHRVAVMAAHFLAARGAPQAWTRWGAELETRDPLLGRLLATLRG